MSDVIVHDGVEYTPTVSEVEYGWCWCTDGEHNHQHHPSVGWAPYWCGSRYNADRTKSTIPFEKRRGMHPVRRRYMVLRTDVEAAS